MLRKSSLFYKFFTQFSHETNPSSLEQKLSAYILNYGAVDLIERFEEWLNSNDIINNADTWLIKDA